jgi:hypothetical protein
MQPLGQREHPYREPEEHAYPFITLMRKGQVVAQRLQLDLDYSTQRQGSNLSKAAYNSLFNSKDWPDSRMRPYSGAPRSYQALFRWLHEVFAEKIQPLHSLLHPKFQAQFQTQLRALETIDKHFVVDVSVKTSSTLEICY